MINRRRIVLVVIALIAVAGIVAAFIVNMSAGERFIAVVAVLTLAATAEAINLTVQPKPKLDLEVVNQTTGELNTAPARGSNQALELHLVNSGNGDAELAEVHHGWLPESSVHRPGEKHAVPGDPKEWQAGARVVPARGSVPIPVLKRAGTTDVQPGEIKWKAWAKGIRETTGTIVVEPAKYEAND